MVSRMKTTIEIPDALAAQAKRVAGESGATLRELVVDGLRSEIERRTASGSRVDFVFTTTAGDGLAPGVDPAHLTDLAYDEHGTRS